VTDDEIIDLYRSGLPMRAVAEQAGRSLSYVATRIRAVGASRDVHTPRTDEAKANISLGKLGTGRGYIVKKTGHIELTGMYEHPLATNKGVVAEAVVVLYAALGDGPHSCHWCGKEGLHWKKKYEGIYVDHLQKPKSNNALENLVVSCFHCNIARENPKYQGHY
jgi:hypothetical protein